MKNTIYLGALFLSMLAGCSRHQPETNPSGPNNPQDITLQPLQVIDLLPAIPEPSGLAYNRIRNTLLVVSDAKPDIFEIGFDGALLRSVPVAGSDLEGVAVTAGGDTLYAVEERNRLVVSCDHSGRRLNTFSVNVATLENTALEGVTVDARGHLWVLNEKDPRMLFEFAGIRELGRREIPFVSDLSGICSDPSGDALWIVSDESRKVIKVSPAGALLAEWPIGFAKGEGIAFAHNKMYIVNDETAKLYVFAMPE